MILNFGKRRSSLKTSKGAHVGIVSAVIVAACACHIAVSPSFARTLSITTEVTATVSLDTDLDGCPDDWEKENGLDLEYPIDGLLDFDDDGVVNVYEFVDKTDPNDSSDYKPNSYQNRLRSDPENSAHLFRTWINQYESFLKDNKAIRDELSTKLKFRLFIKRINKDFDSVRSLAEKIHNISDRL